MATYGNSGIEPNLVQIPPGPLTFAPSSNPKYLTYRQATTSNVTPVSLEKYLELNGKYLKEAQEFSAKGDLVQASEKLWGAAAEIVKAVAASRGISLGTHSSPFEFVSELAKEHPDWSLLDLFQIAGSLHTNYYEGWLTEDFVRRGQEVVETFVTKLKTLI